MEAKVKEKLQALQGRFGVNEIIFLDVCHELEDRLRSYELLATEFGLGDNPGNSIKATESSVAEKNRRLVSSGSKSGQNTIY